MCRVTENRTTETSDLDVLYAHRKAQGSREGGRRWPAEKKKRDYGWMGQMKRADGRVSPEPEHCTLHAGNSDVENQGTCARIVSTVHPGAATKVGQRGVAGTRMEGGSGERMEAIIG